MNPISIIDFISFLAVLTAIIFLVRGWKRTLQRDARLLLAALLGLILFHSLSNVLEWSGITAALDVSEDYIKILVPILWLFLFYTFIQNKAKRDLQAREQRYRSLVDNINMGITLISSDHKILMTNATIGKWLKKPACEFIGKNCFAEFEKRDAVCSHCPGTRAMSTGRPAEVETEGVRDDGSRFSVRIQAFPALNTEGKLTGFIEVIENTTESKRTQRKLEQQAQELACTNADLQQFAYATSHDLQEPLRMVGSYTQLLQQRYQDKLDSDADDFIAYIVEGVERMQMLINGLLHFSRVGTRGKEFHNTDCKDVLNQAVSALQRVITDSNAVITNDTLPTIMADGIQMNNLFQNLIDNAVKFRNGEPPHIHIAAKKDKNHWLFSVKDNGIGIAPEHQERIFQIFQRLHARSEYKGTGIGLAVCRKIIERHGGKIWVESQPNEGSTFCFTIPIRKEITENG